LAAYLDPETHKYLSQNDIDQCEKNISNMFPSERRVSARRRSSYQEQNMEPVEEEVSDDNMFVIDKYAKELGKY
jgi:hypothetical protein